MSPQSADARMDLASLLCAVARHGPAAAAAALLAALLSALLVYRAARRSRRTDIDAGGTPAVQPRPEPSPHRRSPSTGFSNGDPSGVKREDGPRTHGGARMRQRSAREEVPSPRSHLQAAGTKGGPPGHPEEGVREPDSVKEEANLKVQRDADPVPGTKVEEVVEGHLGVEEIENEEKGLKEVVTVDGYHDRAEMEFEAENQEDMFLTRDFGVSVNEANLGEENLQFAFGKATSFERTPDMTEDLSLKEADFSMEDEPVSLTSDPKDQTPKEENHLRAGDDHRKFSGDSQDTLTAPGQESLRSQLDLQHSNIQAKTAEDEPHHASPQQDHQGLEADMVASPNQRREGDDNGHLSDSNKETASSQLDEELQMEQGEHKILTHIQEVHDADDGPSGIGTDATGQIFDVEDSLETSLESQQAEGNGKPSQSIDENSDFANLGLQGGSDETATQAAGDEGVTTAAMSTNAVKDMKSAPSQESRLDVDVEEDRGLLNDTDDDSNAPSTPSPEQDPQSKDADEGASCDVLDLLAGAEQVNCDDAEEHLTPADFSEVSQDEEKAGLSAAEDSDSANPDPRMKSDEAETLFEGSEADATTLGDHWEVVTDREVSALREDQYEDDVEGDVAGEAMDVEVVKDLLKGEADGSIAQPSELNKQTEDHNATCGEEVVQLSPGGEKGKSHQIDAVSEEQEVDMESISLTPPNTSELTNKGTQHDAPSGTTTVQIPDIADFPDLSPACFQHKRENRKDSPSVDRVIGTVELESKTKSDGTGTKSESKEDGTLTSQDQCDVVKEMVSSSSSLKDSRSDVDSDAAGEAVDPESDKPNSNSLAIDCVHQSSELDPGLEIFQVEEPSLTCHQEGGILEKDTDSDDLWMKPHEIFAWSKSSQADDANDDTMHTILDVPHYGKDGQRIQRRDDEAFHDTCPDLVTNVSSATEEICRTFTSSCDRDLEEENQTEVPSAPGIIAEIVTFDDDAFHGDIVGSFQGCKSDRTESEEDVHRVDSAQITPEDVDPTLCQISLPSFEKSRLGERDISCPSVGAESGISSMAVSPDSQDACCDFDMNFEILRLHPEEDQMEVQSRFFADNTELTVTKGDRASMEFGPRSLRQSHSDTSHGSFAANEDIFGCEIEERYHREMGKAEGQMTTGISGLKELKVQESMQSADVIKEKKEAKNVKKKEATDSEQEKDEEYEKTEISIMEATMDNNEWITDGSYQLPWMNPSSLSFAPETTKELPAEENQRGASCGASVRLDDPQLPEAKESSALSPRDENTESSKRAVAVQPVSQNVNVTFCVHYLTRSPDQTVAVTGDQEELGNWKAFIPLRRSKDGHWAAVVSLPAESHVEWKFVVVDEGQVCRWEECGNRFLHTGYGDDLLVHKWWGFI